MNRICRFQDTRGRFSRTVLLFNVTVILCGTAPGCGKNDRETPARSSAETAPLKTPPPGQTAVKSQDEPTTPDVPAPNPNVLLIVVDTLRADRLGCMGYREAPTTPAMDKLAEEGVAFERFYAASPWTGASFASILTGTAPTIHGGGHRTRQKDEGKELLGVRVTPIRQSIPTVPELLSGYDRGAIATNAFLHPDLGFSRGFDTYDHQIAGLSSSRRADETTALAIARLKQTGGKPFFLMVHYFDPHISYDPPIRYRKMFAPQSGGRFQAPFKLHAEARRGELKPTEKEQAFIRGLYNGEVRFVDDEIGTLLAALKENGVLDNTWVFLTADHGEEQFDHGSFDHGHRYEDEVTRVPLIIRPPSSVSIKKGMRVPFTARHVDLAPTILTALHRQVPDHMQGKDLMPLIRGEETQHRPAYVEFNIYWTDRSALVVDGRYKIIRDVDGDTGWFYDLSTDPKEQSKMHDEDRYNALERELFAVRALNKQTAEKLDPGSDKSEGVALPDSVVQSLKALGYLEE